MRYYRHKGSRGAVAAAFGLGLVLACICPTRFLLMALAILLVLCGIAFIKC